MTDSMVRTPDVSPVRDLATMPYAIAVEEDRCAVRHRLAIPAKMRLSCSSSFPVNVLDMSLAGFSCDALLQAHPGTLCWLTLPGLGALEAEVVRHDPAGMGCSFKNLLNQAVLDHFVMRYPPAQS
ncbi:PilZ domain-containing protein [Parasphingorhabdus sp.]|uniref:PilZ domain-containing protein n=1 Tax=Parasphingorhabdus sp. TaxID=2709688 RepID=UPI003001764B